MLSNNEDVEAHGWLRDINLELNKYFIINRLNKNEVKEDLIWQLTNMKHDELYVKRKFGDVGE